MLTIYIKDANGDVCGSFEVKVKATAADIENHQVISALKMALKQAQVAGADEHRSAG